MLLEHLIPIRIQSSTNHPDISEFQSNIRYQRPVVSLVVLTDQRRRWRPTRYRQALWGCEVRLRYPVVKLLDYLGREAELESHRNPFAVVTLAHLKAQDTAKDSSLLTGIGLEGSRGLL